MLFNIIMLAVMECDRHIMKGAKRVRLLTMLVVLQTKVVLLSTSIVLVSLDFGGLALLVVEDILEGDDCFLVDEHHILNLHDGVGNAELSSIPVLLEETLEVYDPFLVAHKDVTRFDCIF